MFITAHLGAWKSSLKQEYATSSQISMSNFNTVFFWSRPGLNRLVNPQMQKWLACSLVVKHNQQACTRDFA